MAIAASNSGEKGVLLFCPDAPTGSAGPAAEGIADIGAAPGGSTDDM